MLSAHLSCNTGLVQQMLVAQEAEAIGGNPLDYKKVRPPAAAAIADEQQAAHVELLNASRLLRLTTLQHWLDVLKAITTLAAPCAHLHAWMLGNGAVPLQTPARSTMP